MQKVAKNGLCLNCNHAEKCIQTSQNGRTINHCEEFSSYQAPARISKTKPLAEKFAMVNGYLGLCRNCEERATCSQSRTDGGIWHCEQYK